MHAAYLGIGEYPENLIAAWKKYDEIYGQYLSLYKDTLILLVITSLRHLSHQILIMTSRDLPSIRSTWFFCLNLVELMRVVSNIWMQGKLSLC